MWRVCWPRLADGFDSRRNGEGGGAAGPGAVAAADPEAGLHLVKSPIVGTYYGSPSPGASPFVAPGDHVDKGQVICIVEAMKLMNEIESDVMARS